MDVWEGLKRAWRVVDFAGNVEFLRSLLGITPSKVAALFAAIITYITQANWMAVLSVGVGFWFLVSALDLLWNRLRRSTSQTVQPSTVPHVALSEQWIEQRFLDLGFNPQEVRRDAGQCTDRLRRHGIFSREAAEAFFADTGVRSTLDQIYRGPELGRTVTTLDPYGYCAWGPILHRATPDERVLAEQYVRTQVAASPEARDRHASLQLSPKSPLVLLREAGIHTLLNRPVDSRTALEKLEQDVKWWESQVISILEGMGVPETDISSFRTLGLFHSAGLSGWDQRHAQLRNILAEKLSRLETVLKRFS